MSKEKFAENRLFKKGQNMNVFVLVGRIADNADLYERPNGKKVINFRVEENRPRFKNDPPVFWQCVAWDATAVELSKRCRKGRSFTLHGELKMGKNKTGEPVMKMDVKVFIEHPQPEKEITSDDVTAYRSAVSYAERYAD